MSRPRELLDEIIAAASLMTRAGAAALAPAAPAYLIMFVTHRCNASCDFCFDRNSPRGGNELSLAEIERIAAHWRGVLQVTLTGGEPFLREDIADLALVWARAGAHGITLDTNGILTDRIVSAVQLLLEKCPRLLLDLNVSLDGPEELHDRLRGVKGAYANALATARALAPLQEQYPGFRLGATVTVSAFNSAEAPAWVRTLAEMGLFRRVQSLWVRGRPHDPAALAADLAAYEQCARSLAGRRASRGLGRVKEALAELVRETVARTVKDDRLVRPCRAGVTMVEVEPDGVVYPCEMLPQLKPEGVAGKGIESWALGSLREADYDIRKVMASATARRVAAWIGDSGCYCTFECAAYNNLVFSPGQWPRILYRVVTGKTKQG
jgi:MoaA/NifB/PqqE/SkfB family radical SAM enzyme